MYSRKIISRQMEEQKMIEDSTILYKIYEYDAILKDIGYQLCELHKQNQSLRQQIHRLEQNHTMGSPHTMRDEL